MSVVKYISWCVSRFSAVFFWRCFSKEFREESDKSKVLVLYHCENLSMARLVSFRTLLKTCETGREYRRAGKYSESFSAQKIVTGNFLSHLLEDSSTSTVFLFKKCNVESFPKKLSQTIADLGLIF